MGGTCPKCFGQIPGEEAPTDPGEEVKQKRRASENRQALLRRLAVAGATLLLLLVTGTMAVWVVFFRKQELPAIDFDDAEYFTPTELVAWAEPEPATATTSTRPDNHVRTSRLGDGTSAFDLLKEPEGALPVTSLGQGDEVRPSESRTTRSGSGDAPGTDLEGPDLSPRASTGSMDFSGVSGPSIQRRYHQGERLTDDEAIVTHIRAVMDAEIPKLTGCYQQYLKADETLAGRWRLDMVVTYEGTVENVTVTGKDVSNADFEACLVARVQQWRFNPLRADQPIGKTITFRPR
jgi:TonB family protein